MEGNEVVKTRKFESFCRGVNPFRNAKVSLLRNYYHFILPLVFPFEPKGINQKVAF